VALISTATPCSEHVARICNSCRGLAESLPAFIKVAISTVSGSANGTSVVGQAETSGAAPRGVIASRWIVHYKVGIVHCNIMTMWEQVR